MAFDDAAMRAALARKRDGEELEPAAWHALIQADVRGDIDDVQMAALLMACAIRGLGPAETAAMTEAFVASGERVPPIPGSVDKHSSGGVGDSVSLIVVPWVAACGVRVAKLSGRALGHTGGTLDKLEAVPGVSTSLGLSAFRAMVERLGCAIAAQTAELVPADKRIYALRDRTATVPEAGLIAASIVSKKIAGGAEAIVYDIKAGSGAFMPDAASATALARTIARATASLGRRCVALVSDMNEPLGRAIGSGLETIEARDFLARPAADDRLARACRRVAEAMLAISGLDRFAEAAERTRALDGALASGAASERLASLLGALGARPDALEGLAPCDAGVAVRAPVAGFVTAIAPAALGFLARELTTRAGPCAGIVTAVRVGDEVARGDRLATLHGDERLVSRALAAFTIGPRPAIARPLFYDTIEP